MTQPEGRKTIYPTKKDLWIIGLLWAGVITMLVGAWNLWLVPESLLFCLGMSILLLASAAFVLWVLYGTNYTLTDRDHLGQTSPMEADFRTSIARLLDGLSLHTITVGRRAAAVAR